MSCCISSAVCCSLVTASLSGVALGYNYSLAEYIDLKETNVSVYLKRGVFDDEIVDDMEWRRAGHLPVAGHIASANLRTGAPEHEETSVRSGRRLDDSVFGSEEQNKFEGSLMKLTAGPLDIISTKPRVTGDLEMSEIIQKYPSGSIDQMKAIQSLINRRKSNVVLTTPKIELKPTATDERDMPPYGPGLLGPNQMEPVQPPSNMNPAIPGVGPVPGLNPLPGSGRRLMPYDRSVYRYLNPARLAVPEPQINQRAYWQYPKVPEKYFPFNAYDENSNIIVGKQTYPPPITLNLGPVRPTRLSTSEALQPTSLPNSPEEEPSRRKLPGNQANVRPEDEAQKIKESLLLSKFDMPSFQNEDVMKAQEGAQKPGDEDYEVEAEGAPVRRKRFTEVSRKPLISSPVDLTESRSKNKFNEENGILSKLTTIYDKAREQQIRNYFSNRNRRHTLMNMDGSVGEFITQIVKLPGVS